MVGTDGHFNVLALALNTDVIPKPSLTYTCAPAMYEDNDAGAHVCIGTGFVVPSVLMAAVKGLESPSVPSV